MYHESEEVHIAVLRLTKTGHVGLSNEVTSLETYASIKHLILNFLC